MKRGRLTAAVLAVLVVSAPIKLKAKFLFDRNGRGGRNKIKTCSVTSDGRLRLEKGSIIKHLEGNEEIDRKKVKALKCGDERSMIVLDNGSIVLMGGYENDFVFRTKMGDVPSLVHSVPLSSEEGAVNSALIDGNSVFLLTKGKLRRVGIEAGISEVVDVENYSLGSIKGKQGEWIVIGLEENQSDLWVKWGSMVEFASALKDGKNTYLLTGEGMLQMLDGNGKPLKEHDLGLDSAEIVRKFGEWLVIRGNDSEGKEFEMMAKFGKTGVDTLMGIPK